MEEVSWYSQKSYFGFWEEKNFVFGSNERNGTELLSFCSSFFLLKNHSFFPIFNLNYIKFPLSPLSYINRPFLCLTPFFFFLIFLLTLQHLFIIIHK